MPFYILLRTFKTLEKYNDTGTFVYNGGYYKINK